MKRLRVISLLGLLLTLPPYLEAQFTNMAIATDIYDQCEVAIAANPTNEKTQMMVFANFKDPSLVVPDYAFSTNMGATWTRGSISQSQFPSGYSRGLVDPSCGFNRSGRAFYCYGLLTSVQFPFADTTRWDIFVAYSDNQGASWTQKKLSGGLGLKKNDKPWMVVDNTGGPRDGWIYVSWTAASDAHATLSQIMFTYSSDGGNTWPYLDTLAVQNGPAANAPITLSQDSVKLPMNTAAAHYVQFSMPTVGRNDSVYVIWADAYDQINPRLYKGSRYKIRVSTTASGPISFSSTVDTTPSFTFETRLFDVSEQLRITNIPCLLADTATGNLYLVYKDQVSSTDTSFRV